MKQTTIKETAKSAAKSLILFALAAISIICLMAGLEEDGSDWWFAVLVGSKVISVGAFWASIKLYDRWSKTDKWLMAYDRECKRTDEAINPMYNAKEAER